MPGTIHNDDSLIVKHLSIDKTMKSYGREIRKFAYFASFSQRIY